MKEYREFVNSLWRLYRDGLISASKVSELYANGKITNEEKWYILK